MQKINIIKSGINKTTYNDVIDKVHEWCRNKESRYICISNVHMVMEAYDDVKFQEILNGADIATPDGMPLVYMQKKLGHIDAERVDGPELTLRLCDYAQKNNLNVGFYGSAKETIDLLTKNISNLYPDLKIGYSMSPPFRELTENERKEITNDINNSKIDILFVGLGCPKQEYWMAGHKGIINSVMVGVGAAFDIHAGNVRRPPMWIRKIGFEWLYRLISEPKRLWKRYFKHNPRFILLGIKQIIGEKK